MQEHILSRSPKGSIHGTLILAGLALIQSSCGSASTPQATHQSSNRKLQTSQEPKGPQQEPKGPQYPPLFASWPANRKPKLVLVLTGEMYGYMRPCGCSEGQHGGLARRGGFLEFLSKEKGWNILPIDSGDLVSRGGRLEVDRYAFALESLKQLGYPVVGIGSKDLSISIDELLGQGINSGPTSLVDSSLQHVEPTLQEILEIAIRPITIQEVGGVRVGIAGIIGESLAKQLPDRRVTLKDTNETITKILKRMKDDQVELKILLAHLPIAEAKALALEHPGFDLILSSSKYEDSATEEAKMVGKTEGNSTMVTWVGRKGKSTGVVGYWPGEKPRLRFELVPLDPRFEELESVNVIYDHFIQSIKTGGYLKNWPRIPLTDDNEFVGAEICGECHSKSYEHWKKTEHAHALQTLADARPKNHQNYNVECVGCHVAGFGFQTGFQTPETTPDLAGVQCENCHGPGGKHSNDPDDPDGIAQVRRTLEQAKGTGSESCTKCHDLENSLHFDFESYWPEIEHPWRD